jgi:hypothetical protein
MKTIISMAFVLVGILIIGIVIYTGINPKWMEANAQNNVDVVSTNNDDFASIDKAQNNVKIFSERSDLPVNFVRNLTANHGKFYEMSTDEATYLVNAKTGEVEAVTYRNALCTSDGTTTLSQEQAESIAITFINKHDMSFATIEDMGLIEANLVDHGTAGSEYMFVWGQCINGILTPTTTMVRIDSATGKINSYASIKRPVEISLVSKVTKDQAVNTAVGQFKNAMVDKTDALLKIVYKEDGTQAVAWIVHIVGQPVNGVIYCEEMIIDANTGEVISK